MAVVSLTVDFVPVGFEHLHDPVSVATQLVLGHRICLEQIRVSPRNASGDLFQPFETDNRLQLYLSSGVFVKNVNGTCVISVLCFVLFNTCPV